MVGIGGCERCKFQQDCWAEIHILVEQFITLSNLMTGPVNKTNEHAKDHCTNHYIRSPHEATHH